MTQIPVKKSRKLVLGKATAKALTSTESSIAPANLLAVSLPSPGLYARPTKPAMLRRLRAAEG